MNAAIITVGDEILLGDIINSNSSWIAKEINKLGIECFSIQTVQDSIQSINSCISNLFKEVDIIFITGGLGPTNDDKTKDALCIYFKTELIYSEEVMKNIKQLFKNIDKNYLVRLNKSQAFIPSKCNIIQNEYGTAPGMWFHEGNKQLISVPGVPFEMQKMMKDILYKLKSNLSLSNIISRTVTVFDIPESDLSQKLKVWESRLNKHIKLAYLPDGTRVKLRLTARGDNAKLLTKQIDAELIKLSKLVSFVDSSIPVGERLANLLNKNGYTISLAESATGGYLSSTITRISGSSQYFKGGIISYQDIIKSNLLSIDTSIIERNSSVSRGVVRQMAENCRLKFNSDFSIATSGYAGPSGGTKENPIGTMFIGISSKDFNEVRKYRFIGERFMIIKQATNAAFQLLIDEINA
ncbi:MAG: CinA family nicotinamide mononucleotide deamidase-related protein [Bacteroidota bacterium]|nr:CinA family nicotinamide mononucleotide deamidase-related protein [Bacteroidota bacterium]